MIEAILESKIICAKHFPDSKTLHSKRLARIKLTELLANLKKLNFASKVSKPRINLAIIKRASKNLKPNSVILGIGGNLKNPARNFANFYARLKKLKFIKNFSTSPLLYNPPFGKLDQPFFYNAVIILESRMSICTLRGLIFYSERISGRPRNHAKNSPRTLDVDVIYFRNKISHLDFMKLPHPRALARYSVIMPLLIESAIR